MNLGIIIGRFQVPELHDGHRLLLSHVIGKHGQVLVLLGCSSVVSPRNPEYNFTEGHKFLFKRLLQILEVPGAKSNPYD